MGRGSWRGAASGSPRKLLWSLVLGTLILGCASAHSRSEPLRVASRTEEKPRPPGVAIDPVLELPRATANAEPVAGLAVLAEPVDPEPARRVVRAFFEAVVAESTFDLERLVDRGAPTRPNAKTRPEPALSWWKRRFDRLDYTALGATVFYRRSDMEAHTARDAAALGPGRALPMVPRGDEVVVRVPIVSQTAEKLFGPELVFRLRKTAETSRAADPEQEGRPAKPANGGASATSANLVPYKIAELFEDFRLP
jgi:hypothetical protein